MGLGEFGRVGLGEVLNFWFWAAWVFGVGKFLVFLCLGWEFWADCSKIEAHLNFKLFRKGIRGTTCEASPLSPLQSPSACSCERSEAKTPARCTACGKVVRQAFFSTTLEKCPHDCLNFRYYLKFHHCERSAKAQA